MLLVFFLKSLALLSALFVFLAANPVHSVLFLILLFCNVAGLLLVLNVEFLALIFIVVYVGAIAVLFLFVCMMLNVKLEEMQGIFLNFFPISSFVLFILLVQFFSFVSQGWPFAVNVVFANYLDWFALLWTVDHIVVLAFLLYNYFFLNLILVALALFVAMLGSIKLTLYHRLDVKRQVIYEQVKQQVRIFK